MVVGESGVGKSSVINLVIDASRAVTGSNVRGMTTTTEFHDWGYDTQTFRLWDTPGLNEGSKGTVPPKRAENAIRSLLTELSGGGGVHLLVLCMRGNQRVTTGTKLIYETVVGIRNKIVPDVPLVAVITGLEGRWTAPLDTIYSMGEWWKENVQALTSFDMAFSAHACITTLYDDCHPNIPGRRNLCRELVRRRIVQVHSPKLAHNIAIVGESGAGKSSLVNLVLNSQKAVVRDCLRPRVDATRDHDWEIDNQTFRLWDTPGLGERLDGSGPEGLEALESLFMRLNEKGGVHLLIICIRGVSEITMASKETHKHIKKMHARFCPATPMVAVITELEDLSTTDNPLPSMERWWMTNSGTFYDFALSGHACITTLPDDGYSEVSGRRELCQGLARDLIINQSLPLQTLPPKDLHVLLFGETGVGKSSLVNLLAGWKIASISPDSVPCTLDSTEYQFQFGSTTVRLWDTVGLQEPDKGQHGYIGAIEKAVNLVRRLNATGGISLFLFCIRGNRITATMQSNYRLFYEVLGKKEVPIAFVVTNLEREQNMEQWWVQNSKELEKSGMVSAEHACITALEGHPRYAESRDILRGLLSRFDDQGRFSMPPEDWISRTLKGLRALFKKSFPRGRDLVSILTKRCSLNHDVAQRVAACIDTDSTNGRSK